MHNNLTMSLIQYDIFWEDKIANMAFLEETFAQLPPTDLIVLPEMFTTGFTMRPKLFAEPHNLTTFKWLKQIANQQKASVVGSYIVNENNRYYNRLLYVEPDGNFAYYDKKHLFTMGEENKYYQAGNKHLIVNWRGWRIAFFICYDIRFPVWCRNNPENPYDVAIFVANFPASRQHVWTTLLQARAIENTCYTVGVNRIGTDGREIEHNGYSMIVNYKGEILEQLPNISGTLTRTLLPDELNEFRIKFPVLNDADTFTIH